MSPHDTDSDTVIVNEYPALPVGTVLNNYTIGRELGRGGFGITYHAQERMTGRRVVIKENFPMAYARRDPDSLQLLPMSDAHQEGFDWSLKHFIDEAAILTELDHPNIVTVLTTFEALGTAYYVMKPINGTELHESLPEPGSLTEQQLRPILVALLSALGHLHEQNLLHRDIKLSNIILRKNGSPMLIDFGLARQVGKNSAVPVGTKGYTPHEQYAGNVSKQGPWSDLYALGATFHALITGNTPPDSLERLDDDTYQTLAGQKELHSRFSPAFLTCIDKSLALFARYRWQSAREWLNSLTKNSAPAENATTTPRPSRKGHSGKIAAGLATALLLGGGAYYGANYYNEWQAEQQENFRIAAEEETARKAEEEAARKAAEEEAARKAEEEAARKAEEEAARKAAEEEAARKLEEDRRAFIAEIDRLLAARVYDGLAEKLRPYAEQGYAPAQARLGYFYIEPYAIEKNPAVAYEWFCKAVEQGDARGMNGIGWCYLNGYHVEKNYDKAVEWYRKAVAKGDSWARTGLGWCYQHGLGVEKDEVRAVELYRQSAETGLAEAQHNLGACYYFGQGVEQDYDEALIWFQKAADKKLPQAQNLMSVCYTQGHGVEQNQALAFEWALKAADQGLASAQTGVGYRYQNGIGVQENAQQAVKWYRKAAEQEYADAQNLLGLCYDKGYGVEQDYKQAVEWYQKALQQGNMFAQNNLGTCYYLGHGVEKNYTRAAELFRESAEQDNPQAQSWLGECYEKGRGVPKSKTEAIKWYRKAAAGGISFAKDALKRLDK